MLSVERPPQPAATRAHRARKSLAALALAAGLLCAPPARAEIMDTTATLGPGKITLGVEMQAALHQSTPLGVNFHEAVGLSPGFDLALREGYGFDEGGVYLGAAIKWTLVYGSRRHSRPGVALWLGGHGGSRDVRAGADATIAIDYPFRRVRPYLGLDSNLEFSTHDAELLLGLIGGAQLDLVQHVTWYVEGGLGILGTVRPHFISTGPRIFF